MVAKTTNWQVRLPPKLANLIRQKAKIENRSYNGTITLILEYYFNLKEERVIEVQVTSDEILSTHQE